MDGVRKKGMPDLININKEHEDKLSDRI